MRVYSYDPTQPDKTSGVDYFVSIAFFITIMILGNIILMSLFTAIMLRNFQGTNSGEEEKEKPTAHGTSHGHLKEFDEQNELTCM